MQKSKLKYIKKINKYISTDGTLYIDNDLDFLDKLEKEWKKTQPHFSFRELMNIFPEAVKPARKGMKAKIKFYKEQLNKLTQDHEDHYNNVIAKADFRRQTLLKEMSDRSHDKMFDKLSKKIRTYKFQLSYLDELEGKPNRNKVVGSINEADIERAKEVPIENFYNGNLRKWGKRATGKCPFHNDTNASLTIYLDQNSFYCYGCQSGGSVIDFIMLQQNIDFLSAVKFLIK